MGEWRDRASSYLVDFLLKGMRRKATQRADRVKDLQAKHAEEHGRVTKIQIFEENMHLRDRMDIGTKELIVRGNGGGGWDTMPAGSAYDNLVRVNASTLKGIATGRLDLPVKGGGVKHFAPPNSAFTAADAVAWGLFEWEGKTGGLKSLLTFDREVEKMFSDLRLYDEQGNYIG